MVLNMVIEKWLGIDFESSCYKTPQFLSFANDFKKYIKASLKGDVKSIKFNVEHFYIFGFIEKLDGQLVYFNISDVRFFKDAWYNNLLYRSATSTKDYTGGMNHHVELRELKNAIGRKVI